MKTLSVLAAAMAFAGSAADAATVQAALEPAPKRSSAAAFRLEDSAGKRVEMKNYRGKVLLLNFWATWCGGCKEEMPWFQEFANTLGPRRLAVLGVSVDEDGWTAVKPFLAKSGIRYRMALADKPILDSYPVKNLPATFLIDRKGRIAAVYTGLVDRADVEDNLRSLLRER